MSAPVPPRYDERRSTLLVSPPDSWVPSLTQRLRIRCWRRSVTSGTISDMAGYLLRRDGPSRADPRTLLVQRGTNLHLLVGHALTEITQGFAEQGGGVAERFTGLAGEVRRSHPASLSLEPSGGEHCPSCSCSQPKGKPEDATHPPTRHPSRVSSAAEQLGKLLPRRQ